MRSISYITHTIFMPACNPMDCSLSGTALFMEFSRQEYWSWLPFFTPEHTL